jgi:hypothetical protein
MAELPWDALSTHDSSGGSNFVSSGVYVLGLATMLKDSPNLVHGSLIRSLDRSCPIFLFVFRGGRGRY